MTAGQALMRGAGGWPLSIWMNAEKKPFAAGTYFPKRANPALGARMGFIDVLEKIRDAWKDPEQRKQITELGQRVVDHVQEAYDAEEPEKLHVDALDTARSMAEFAYDDEHGGFAGRPRHAPKFPSPSTLEMVLRYGLRKDDTRARNMVVFTLKKMERGGIHDHVGGGFHRYSVTRDWLVPHFEKMLYDNAQLLGLYSWAHLVTGEASYADTARDIATWVLREMTHKRGGFYSAQDADDPGGPEGEGGFYVWDPEEVTSLLGEQDAAPVLKRFGIRPEGNWPEKPGKSLLQVVDKETPLDPQVKERMYLEREKRPKPLTDTKVLAAWNGLMVSGFCRAYQALGEQRMLDAAVKCGAFLRAEMTREDGRLGRRWEDGDLAHEAVLPDYAYVTAAYLDLYETTFDEAWLEEAMRLNALAIELFFDPKEGGFFFTANDAEELFARGKPGYDNARPSGNGVMAFNLLRLAELNGDLKLRETAAKTLDYFGARVTGSAIGYSAILNALDFSNGPREIFIAGEPGDEATMALVRAVWRDPDINRVLAIATPRAQELLPPAKGKGRVDGKPAAYVCRNFTCDAPVTDPGKLGR
jgi:uncharacterized protein YyaL (SSP411 family)